MSISPRRGVRGLENWYGWNIIMYITASCIHFQAEHWQKCQLYGKKLQVKVVLNYIPTKNSVNAYVFHPPHTWIRAIGLQRLMCFKYDNVLKLEIRFTLEWNADKNTDYMKKSFK